MQNISILTLTLVATALISRYRGVGFDGAQATVQGQKVAGFARHDAAIGESVPVDSKGTLVAETGAPVAVGDTLIVDAQGRVIPGAPLAVQAGGVAVTSTAANGEILEGAALPDFAVGEALESAAGAGEFIEILAR
jgi:hypothetical protein